MKRHFVVWSGEGTGPASKIELRFTTERGIKRILTNERCGGDRWARAFYKPYGVGTEGVDFETGEVRSDVFTGNLRYWEM
jgi:hypothetical protein